MTDRSHKITPTECAATVAKLAVIRRRNFLGTGGGADNDLRPCDFVPVYMPVKQFVSKKINESVVKEIVFGTTDYDGTTIAMLNG